MMSARSATVIAAECGYNLLVFMGDDANGWTVGNTRKFPIIAWQFNDDGLMMPRSINPVFDNMANGRFIIELPDGRVVGYALAEKQWWFCSSIDEWIQTSKMANTPFPLKPN